MRADINVTKRDGYKFVLEYDTGGTGGEYTCWIYFNGKPLKRSNDGWQVRRSFGTKCNRYHYNNFIRKFLSDESYRNKYLSGQLE